MQTKRIRLFIKPYCPWCKMAMEWLDERGIKYERIDVIASEAAYDEMVRLSGQTRVPVLEVEGQVLADFGPDELEQFWNKVTGTGES